MADMELKLAPRLVQKLGMTPQLQQAMKLLQCSRLELQQALSQHVMDNPLLEEFEELHADFEEGDGASSEGVSPVNKEDASDDRDDGEEKERKPNELYEPISSAGWEDYYESDGPPGGGARSLGEETPSYEQTLENPTSLQDHVLWQLRLSSEDETERTIGLMVVGNLDDDGYLRTSIEDIAEEAGVSVNTVDSVLSLIQTFDPVGVASRDLQECLMIQLRHLHKTPVGNGYAQNGDHQCSLLEQIIKHHLCDLQKKRYAKVAKTVGRSVEEIEAAVHVIEGLEPKPGRPFGRDTKQVIVPDVVVRKDAGEWQVFLNEEGMPRIRISREYERMLENKKVDGKDERVYLKEKLRGARWIIRTLEKRNRTILKVVRSLIKFQEPFLERGVQYLKPCALKQVAEDVEMHASTVSRVTRNKYMHCPQGLLELKFFFSSSIPCANVETREFSLFTVCELIRHMVGQEDVRTPLKDQDIVSRLRVRGIVVTRRSVAKYRDKLRIAPASQRKRGSSAAPPRPMRRASGMKRQKKEKTPLGLRLEEILRVKGVAKKDLVPAVTSSPSGISNLLRQTVWTSKLLENISAYLRVPKTTFLECYGEHARGTTRPLQKT